MQTHLPIFIIIIFAILYGTTMKIADLLNEHGLRWFTGSNILFGVLWGIFGAVLVIITNPLVGSILVAMNIAFIIRGRLDYLNHQIAASLIIITGILLGNIEKSIFLIFFLIFLIFGSLKDYVDDRLHSKRFLAKINELMLYYPIPTLIYGSITGAWLPFIVFTFYTIAYDFTKLIAIKKGYQ